MTSMLHDPPGGGGDTRTGGSPASPAVGSVASGGRGAGFRPTYQSKSGGWAGFWGRWLRCQMGLRLRGRGWGRGRGWCTHGEGVDCR